MVERDPKAYLLERVLEQNERLLSAVLRMAQAQSPVEIIRALNPSVVAAVASVVDPWDADESRVAGPDVWGDPEIPFDQLVAEPPVPGSREEEGE